MSPLSLSEDPVPLLLTALFVVGALLILVLPTVLSRFRLTAPGSISGAANQTKPLCDWYTVTWDDVSVRLDVRPPLKDGWQADFRWDEITAVCFEAEELISDGLYIFTTQRPESWAVPTEANGGAEFLNELVTRKLFDAELLIEACTSGSGQYWWPPRSEI